jgi:hypothetical protein
MTLVGGPLVTMLAVSKHCLAFCFDIWVLTADCLVSSRVTLSGEPLNGLVGDDEQLKEAIDLTVIKQVSIPKVRFSFWADNDDILFNRPSLASGGQVVITILD